MSFTLRVPDEVATAAQERWPLTGARWANDVDAELSDLCDKYLAKPVSVVGGRYSVVIFAESPNGDIAFRATADSAGSYQGRAATLLAAVRAGPTVHDVLTTDTGTWTVMDRVVPGTPLREAPHGAVEFDDVVTTFRAIAGADTNCDDLPSLADWLHKRLEDDVLTDRVLGSAVAPDKDRSRALSILQDLGNPRSLCHGDTHPGNLLVSARPPRLLLIDPRGMRGEVAYDVGVFSIKAAAYDVEAARVLVGQLALQSGADIDRAAAWMAVAMAARV